MRISNILAGLVACLICMTPCSAGEKESVYDEFERELARSRKLAEELGGLKNIKNTDLGTRSTMPQSDQLDIYNSAGRGDLATVEAYIRNGFDVNTPDSSGRTALYMAAINDQLAMVKLLLESGAEPNGVFEQEPLLICVIKSRQGQKQPDETGVVNCLLERGADAKATDKSGKTALDIALSENLSEHSRLLRQYNN